MKKIISWLKPHYISFFTSSNSIGMYDIENEDILLPDLVYNTLDMDLIYADIALVSACPAV